MKKIIISMCAAIALAAVFAVLLWFGKKESLALPKKEAVVTVQTDTTKISTKQFGEEKLSKLIADMEAAPPLTAYERKKIQRKDNYYALSFLYDDNTRDIFYFFAQDGNWYMETAQGQLYGSSEFITKYTSAQEKITEKSVFPAIMQAAKAPDSKLIKYGMETSYDMRYRIAQLVNNNMEEGLSMEDAFLQAYDSMKMNAVLYQCAVEEGYEITEEKYTELQETWLTYIEQSENYEELEQSFQEAGTTFRSASEAGRETGRRLYIIECLRQAKRDGFRNGEDSVGGIVYDTADEYWNGYAWSMYQAAMESGSLEEFQRDYEEAKAAVIKEFELEFRK